MAPKGRSPPQLGLLSNFANHNTSTRAAVAALSPDVADRVVPEAQNKIAPGTQPLRERRIHPWGRSVSLEHKMTHRSWKLSQIVSLAFIGLIFGFAMLGSLFGPSQALLSDVAAAPIAAAGV
ncbi:MAG: hypothetical protein EON93_11190 [Burkholderiales bacterium]|nr:MAG: hypothetical protein EON93_11190 [Burkholderiales bacterium]